MSHARGRFQKQEQLWNYASLYEYLEIQYEK